MQATKTFFQYYWLPAFVSALALGPVLLFCLLKWDYGWAGTTALFAVLATSLIFTLPYYILKNTPGWGYTLGITLIIAGIVLTTWFSFFLITLLRYGWA